jgi:hypothetical protein
LRSENAKHYDIASSHCVTHVLYPLLGVKRGKQDGWGAVGMSGRVKFLPLAWAGMPKTSFRKNSDSPIGQRLAPHIYSEQEIVDLLAAARNLGSYIPRLRGATYETLLV